MLWPSLAVISQDLSSPTPTEFSLEAKISIYQLYSRNSPN